MVAGSFLGLPLWACVLLAVGLLSIVGLLSCSWVLGVVHGGGVGFALSRGSWVLVVVHGGGLGFDVG